MERIWNHPAFLGVFGDPYLRHTALERSGCPLSCHQSINLICELLTARDPIDSEMDLLLNTFQQAIIDNSLIPKLKSCSQWILKAHNVTDSISFTQFLQDWHTYMLQIEPGDSILIPAGYNQKDQKSHLIFFVIQRVHKSTSKGNYQLTVCNKGPGADMYHSIRIPADGACDKLKVKSCITIQNITGERMLNPTFWALVFSLWMKRAASEYHRVEVLYDVLLPWLSGDSLLPIDIQDLDDGNCEFHSIQRSDLGYFTSLIEAIRYLCLKASPDKTIFQPEMIKFGLLFRLQIQFGKKLLLSLQSAKTSTGNVPHTASSDTFQVLYHLTMMDSLQKNHTLNPVDGSSQRIVALYFADFACKQETNELIALSENLNAKQKDFIVVVVSLDPDLAAFQILTVSLPVERWFIVPFSETQARLKLVEILQVRRIPSIFFLEEGERGVITSRGVSILKIDPKGELYPWKDASLKLFTEPISCSEFALVEMATRQLGKKAVMQHDSKKLSSKGLEIVYQLIQDIDNEVKELRQLPTESVTPRAKDMQHDGALFRLEIPAINHTNIELLSLSTDVNAFAGDTDTRDPEASQNGLVIPKRVDSIMVAIGSLVRCRKLCKSLMERSMATSSSSKLVIHHQVIRTISQLFIEAFPVPIMKNGVVSNVWGELLPQKLQLSCLRLISELMITFTYAWQSIEHPSRSFDAERSLTALCGLAIFDAVVRTPAQDDPMMLSLLLQGKLPGSCFVYVLAHTFSRSNISILKTTNAMELVQPSFAVTRGNVLAYFDANNQNREAPRHQLFTYHMQEDLIEMKRYSSTLQCIRGLLEHYGISLINPDDPNPQSEMEALIEWFCSSTPLCPDIALTRDFVLLVKFLVTMETRETELLHRRVPHQMWQNWQLTHTDGRQERTTRNRTRDFEFILSHALKWKVSNIRGQEQDIADVQVHIFGDRKILFGEGLLLQSPAAIAPLMASISSRNVLTDVMEDDILYAETLPTFDGTLSMEEAEYLLSFLTVPYTRIPLVLSFFASGDRFMYLFNRRLQRVLYAVLFEVGNWVYHEEKVIQKVPLRKSSLSVREDAIQKAWNASFQHECCEDHLGTRNAVLLNELLHASNAVLGPIETILKASRELGRCSVYSPGASFVLFVIKLCADITRYTKFVLDVLINTSQLDHWLQVLRDFMAGFALETLDIWLEEAESEHDISTACTIHSYRAVCVFNSQAGELTDDRIAQLLGSIAYVRNWHRFGSRSAEANPSTEKTLNYHLMIALFDGYKHTESARRAFRLNPCKIPNFRSESAEKGCSSVLEAEIMQLLQANSRDILAYMDAMEPLGSQMLLDRIVRVALRSTDTTQSWSWRPVDLIKSPGRYRCEQTHIQIDLQTGELIWRQDALRPVPGSMTQDEDYKQLFGDRSLHCGVIGRQEHRFLGQYRIGAPIPCENPIGEDSVQHPMYWECLACTCSNYNGDEATASCQVCGTPRSVPVSQKPEALGFIFLDEKYSRVFDPFDEKIEPHAQWIRRLLRKTSEILYKDKGFPFQLFVSDAMDPNCSVVRMIAFDEAPLQSSDYSAYRDALPTYKELILYRVFEVVHIFALVSHGRRVYRQQIFTLDTRISLHSFDANKDQRTDVCFRASAETLARSCQPSGGSLAIRRYNETLGGSEQLIPSRLLQGIVPSVLLEAFTFWLGDDNKVRGEPLATDTQWFRYRIEVDCARKALIRKPFSSSLSMISTETSPLPSVPPLARCNESNESHADNVMELMAMGFSNAACHLALKETRNKLDDAAQWLLADENRVKVVEAEYSDEICREEESTAVLLSLGFSKGAVKYALDIFDQDASLSAAWLSDPDNEPEIKRVGQNADKVTLSERKEPSERKKKSPNSEHIDGKSAKATEEQLFYLNPLNVLNHSEDDRELLRLISLVTRLEDLSHVLIWCQGTHIKFIEFPRLKLKLFPRKEKVFASDYVRFFVSEQSEWFVSSKTFDLSNDSDPLGADTEHQKLLEWSRIFPEAIYIESLSNDLHLLCPNFDVYRPLVIHEPFSISVLSDRSSRGWLQAMESRYYLYDIHSSHTFLLPPSLSASLYLSLLAILRREYTKAMQMISTCTIDTAMTAEEAWVFSQLSRCVDDRAPNACAYRLKLTLAIGSAHSVPWDVNEELYDYIVTQKHVSALCRLSLKEEADLLEIATDRHGRFQLLGARKAYCEASLGGGVPRVSYAPLLRVGGLPWVRIRAYSKAYLQKHGRKVSMVRYIRPKAEALELLWENKLLRDEVNGSTCSMGFLYLYEILCGELPIKGDAISFVDLMTRFWHLKLSRWGHSSTEVEEHASLAISQLAMMITERREASQPLSIWPQLPSDTESTRWLATGLKLYSETAETSPVKAFFDAVHATMESNLESAFHQRTITRLQSVSTRLCGLMETRSIRVKGCSVTRSSFDASDTSCDSLTYTAQDLDPLHLCSASVEVETFVEVCNDHNKLFDKLPFDISGHPAANTNTARDLISRLDQDIANYASSMRDREQVFFIGVTADALSTPDFDSACRSAISRLDSLHAKCLQMEARDQLRVVRSILQLETMANTVVPVRDQAQKDKQIRFALERRSGMYPSVTFDFLIPLLMAQDAALDLCKRNPFSPFQSEDSMEQLRQQLIDTTLLCGRIVHMRNIVRAVKSLKALLTSQQISPNRSDTLQQTLQTSKQLAALLTSTRSYMYPQEPGEWRFDPRFLVFEFVFDITLRRRQVEMIESFVKSLSAGQSRVQQMIMGAGKTTVVGPLLTLILASRDQLVIHVMPSALLEQTRRVLRKRFGTIVFGKRVLTLDFDRNVAQDPQRIRQLCHKLCEAQRDTDVVCASPESIKSLYLKFIELLHSLEASNASKLFSEATQHRSVHRKRLLRTLESHSEMADGLLPILHLWKSSVLIMDEVDVLLHPLRSELNFPLGDTYPIDLAPIRWEFPVFLLDCVLGPLHEAHEALGTEFGQAFAQLEHVIEHGYASHAFQRFPHLVLLDEDFYMVEMAPLLAQMTARWLSQHNSIGSVSFPRLCWYLQASHHAISKASDVDLSEASFKLVNFAREWILTFLPHVLSKINRVSYGLLGSSNEHQRSSRLLLAVPFIGKDVPSRSSEFAHPDILIGMTILAYRYEGLRMSDLLGLFSQLKHDFSRQVGPHNQREAAKTFQAWVHLGQTRFQSHTPPNVLPLSLFNMNDTAQRLHLFSLVAKLIPVVKQYLCQQVFPACIKFQKLKISASGFELGGASIFGKRIGFSGTPSNLLPMDLGACLYEPMSDGGIFHALTDPAIVTIEKKRSWSSMSLLLDVARAVPPFHALIDTGALITGYDNEQVARFLLTHLPMEMEGVAFLDREDRPMILLRDHFSPLALDQCSQNPSKRFTFYDQVHTTGMDISQAANARAVLTLGKDTTFRDFAQGAYRMRGITMGQTIHLYLIPEVEHLIRLELETISMEMDLMYGISAWLLINSMRTESMQFVQLSIQELHNTWRTRALHALMDEVHRASAVGRSDTNNRMKRFLFTPKIALDKGEDEKTSCSVTWLCACVHPFRQEISYRVQGHLPLRKSFPDTINDLIEKHSQFLTREEDCERVRAVQERFHTKAPVIGMENGYAELTSQVVHENQVEAEEQAEQQVEQEEQKMSAFSRDEEHPVSWKVNLLNQFPSDSKDTPFYRLSSFQVESQSPNLHFPSNLLISSNFYRPQWIGLGERRLKNCNFLLQFSPFLIRETYKAAVHYFFHQLSLETAHDPSRIAVQSLQKAKALFQQPQIPPSELLNRWRAIWSQQPMYLLIVSLAEGETLRRILHQCHPITSSCFLRVCTMDGKAIDDAWGLWWMRLFDEENGVFERHAMMIQCARFFNNEVYYSTEELALLRKALDVNCVQNRQKFFEDCMSRRRRVRHLWGDTAVAKIFTSMNEWHLIHGRARLERFTCALREKEVKLSKEGSGRCVPDRPGGYLVASLRQYEVIDSGKISMESLLACFQQFRLGYSPLELDELVQLIKASVSTPRDTLLFVRDICGLFNISASELVLIDKEIETLQQSKSSFDSTQTPEYRDSQNHDPIEFEQLLMWQCSSCTCYNPNEDEYCEVCDLDQQGRRKIPTGKWICAGENGGCTFFNSMGHFYCQVCHRARSDLSPHF
uniref:ubiquitinyl hydrolase 1 n=1 Tax=Albugo laibachii Nc14 TaxID=890382 RepID=F0WWQ5_9STRA|nr:hypothetical protein ALNC14_120260 [Albugo laibachii Nc14]|eukprot:CCA25882.1 hypothetical protein ALNC14_120260 [Albugo laibachii Nc14]